MPTWKNTLMVDCSGRESCRALAKSVRYPYFVYDGAVYATSTGVLACDVAALDAASEPAA